MTYVISAIAIFVVYLLLGHFLHRVVFPEKRPDARRYLNEGDSFGSASVGDKISVVERLNGQVRLKLEFAPEAEGPPMHIQTGWDETFKTISGTLGLIVDGEKIMLQPGKAFTVKKGAAHKPYNPTDKPVAVDVVMPADFALGLSQVYGYMDEDEQNMQPPKVIFQMAMFNQYFDSYLAEGPPVAVQKAVNFVLIPIARLLGFKSYYDKFRIKQTAHK